MRKKIIIVGTSLYSEIMSHYITNYKNEYEIIGYSESVEILDKNEFLGKKVYELEKLNLTFDKEKILILNSIGYKSHNKLREKRFLQLKKVGFKFMNFLSKDATILTNKIGENCIILENNVIQPFVEIKDNVFIWSGNHIGHHSVIGENCFISSHSVISGNCKIGKNTFLGVNSTITDGVKIGNFCTIGANSLVNKNLDDHSVVKSEPSKFKIIQRDII
tara:strand:+ start:126 stop:782 length:657 start_codon:yes stop_codon:yes gene_type:complete